MIMIVISFALVKFYAFAILYVLIVMQIKLVVVKKNLKTILFKNVAHKFAFKTFDIKYVQVPSNPLLGS